jgi:transposase-like protein
MAVEFGPGLRNRLFAALSGISGADVSGQGEDLRGMLLAVGGPSSKTRSGIDLTKAAAQLGVSRRTCERWVQTAAAGQGQRPSASHARTLTRKARQAASTKAGRRTAVQAMRERQVYSRGARLSIRGRQGPARAGKNYQRDRLTQLDLDPADAEAMLAAYEQGGDRGFLDWATATWDQQYLDDWGFQTIEEIDIQPPTRW